MRQQAARCAYSAAAALLQQAAAKVRLPIECVWWSRSLPKTATGLRGEEFAVEMRRHRHHDCAASCANNGLFTSVQQKLKCFVARKAACRQQLKAIMTSSCDCRNTHHRESHMLLSQHCAARTTLLHPRPRTNGHLNGQHVLSSSFQPLDNTRRKNLQHAARVCVPRNLGEAARSVSSSSSVL